MLAKYNIESFDSNEDKHVEIANLCKRGHLLKENDQKADILTKINKIVAEIYEIDDVQMALIKDELVNS